MYHCNIVTLQKYVQVSYQMKKLLFIIVCLITSFGGLKAQVQDSPTTMKVYCEVMCVQYNLFKGDVNAVVDFGIADKAKNADGWIYNT